jgi:hypothetical protein
MILRQTVAWTRNPLYAPHESQQEEVLGYHLVVDGLPRLSVDWEVGDDQSMSMMHLFGFSKEVPYEQLCQTTSLRSSLLSSTVTSLLTSLSKHSGSSQEKKGNFLGGLTTNSKGKRSSVLLSR